MSTYELPFTINDNMGRLADMHAAVQGQHVFPNSHLLFNTVTATHCKHSDYISGSTN